MRRWVGVGPSALLDMLVPLRDEHRRFGPAELIPLDSDGVERFLKTSHGEHAAVLVLEDPTAPSICRTFRSPLIREGGAANNVCIGWLRLDARELGTYASRAVDLLNRAAGNESTLVLLAPRERRYLELLEELEIEARPLELETFRWSAERIRSEPLTRALRLGASTVLYSGHGNPNGWFAYGGLTAQMLAGGAPWTSDQTNAVMFSLSCSTGRGRSGSAGPQSGAHRSFADSIVADGVAGTVLAPLGDPLHADSRVLARAIVNAMPAGTSSLCDMLESIQRQGGSLDGYALVGDPALAVRSSVGAGDRGAAVFAPAADAELPTASGRAAD